MTTWYLCRYIVSISYPTFTSALIRPTNIVMTSKICIPSSVKSLMLLKCYDRLNRGYERNHSYILRSNTLNLENFASSFSSFFQYYKRGPRFPSFGHHLAPSTKLFREISFFSPFVSRPRLFIVVYIYIYIYTPQTRNNFTASRNENILEPPFLYELQNRAIKEGSMCFPYGIRFRTL